MFPFISNLGPRDAGKVSSANCVPGTRKSIPGSPTSYYVCDSRDSNWRLVRCAEKSSLLKFIGRCFGDLDERNSDSSNDVSNVLYFLGKYPERDFQFSRRFKRDLGDKLRDLANGDNENSAGDNREPFSNPNGGDGVHLSTDTIKDVNDVVTTVPTTRKVALETTQIVIDEGQTSDTSNKTEDFPKDGSVAESNDTAPAQPTVGDIIVVTESITTTTTTTTTTTPPVPTTAAEVPTTERIVTTDRVTSTAAMATPPPPDGATTHLVLVPDESQGPPYDVVTEGQSLDNVTAAGNGTNISMYTVTAHNYLWVISVCTQ